jgi:hypothetical protein
VSRDPVTAERPGRAGSLTQGLIIASTEPKLSSVIFLRVLAIATMDTKSNEKGIENDENATLEACSSNDLATLQRLLDDNGQQPANYQLDIRKLFAAAVASKQTTVVEFLLQKYPTYSYLLLLRGVWDHPIYPRQRRCGHTSGALHSRLTLRKHLRRLRNTMLHHRRLCVATRKDRPRTAHSTRHRC